MHFGFSYILYIKSLKVLKSHKHFTSDSSYLSVDQRDADPVIVKQEAALGSVVVELLQTQCRFKICSRCMGCVCDVGL